jgi:hypothetical protein
MTSIIGLEYIVMMIDDLMFSSPSSNEGVCYAEAFRHWSRRFRWRKLDLILDDDLRMNLIDIIDVDI